MYHRRGSIRFERAVESASRIIHLGDAFWGRLLVKVLCPPVDVCVCVNGFGGEQIRSHLLAFVYELFALLLSIALEH